MITSRGKSCRIIPLKKIWSKPFCRKTVHTQDTVFFNTNEETNVFYFKENRLHISGRRDDQRDKQEGMMLPGSKNVSNQTTFGTQVLLAWKLPPYSLYPPDNEANSASQLLYRNKITCIHKEEFHRKTPGSQRHSLAWVEAPRCETHSNEMENMWSNHFVTISTKDSDKESLWAGILQDEVVPGSTSWGGKVVKFICTRWHYPLLQVEP